MVIVIVMPLIPRLHALDRSDLNDPLQATQQGTDASVLDAEVTAGRHLRSAKMIEPR
jgi:hypothetical protein